MATQSKLIVEFLDDGTIKTNARDVIGDEDEIMELLEEVAEAAGGQLKVEKHEPGLHHHHHGHSHTHGKVGGGGHSH